MILDTWFNPSLSYVAKNDEEKQVYRYYNKNEFLVPSSEIRYEDEIKSIKKYYKLEDRKQFFRK